MGKSNYLEDKINDHVLGGPDYTRPGTVYIALFKGSPTDTGSGGAEVSGGSYARKDVTNNATNFPASSGGSKSNGTIITFVTPTADWCPAGNEATHFAIFDAVTSGNMLRWGALNTAKVIQNGDPVSFPVGSLVCTED